MNHIELLRAHLEAETEGSRTPAQSAEAEEQAALDAMMETSGIRKVEQLLDGEYMRRVLTLTPEAWGVMTPLERHQMAQWTERRIKLLSEKLAFQRRNAGADVEVPEWLREKAV